MESLNYHIWLQFAVIRKLQSLCWSICSHILKYMTGEWFSQAALGRSNLVSTGYTEDKDLDRGQNPSIWAQNCSVWWSNKDEFQTYQYWAWAWLIFGATQFLAETRTFAGMNGEWRNWHLSRLVCQGLCQDVGTEYFLGMVSGERSTNWCLMDSLSNTSPKERWYVIELLAVMLILLTQE